MLKPLKKIAALAIGSLLLGLFAFQIGVSYEYQHNKNPPRKDRSEHSQTEQAEPKGAAKASTVHIECEPNCTAKPPDERGEQRSIYGRVYQLIQKSVDDPVAAFTGLLFFATIGLAFLARTQIKDGRILQRAYIRAVPKGVNNMTTGEIVGHVSFENVGKLPATNFRWIVKALTFESGTWEPPKLLTAICWTILASSRSPGYFEEERTPFRRATRFQVNIGLFGGEGNTWMGSAENDSLIFATLTQ